MINKKNKNQVDLKLVNANDFWLDFKRLRFDTFVARIANGEAPKFSYPKTGLTIPKGGSDFFCDRLREACEKRKIELVEFDCRSITCYNDALGFIRRLASGNAGPKVVHISHYTEIPDVANRQAIGNVLVSSWKNKDVCVADVVLDARPLLVFLSCEEGAESDFDPWDRNAQLGRYVYAGTEQ